MDTINKWVVLKEEVLKPEYRDIKSRMFFVQGGFGAHANTMGTAIIGHHVDGESTRWDRFQIERLATEKEIETYVREEAKS